MTYVKISARRNTEEEKDFQEVYFSWSGPGSAVGYASVSSRCCKRKFEYFRSAGVLKAKV
jgi:hypothetical protein